MVEEVDELSLNTAVAVANVINTADVNFDALEGISLNTAVAVANVIYTSTAHTNLQLASLNTAVAVANVIINGKDFQFMAPRSQYRRSSS